MSYPGFFTPDPKKIHSTTGFQNCVIAFYLVLLIATGSLSSCVQDTATVSWFLTNPDKSALFTKQVSLNTFHGQKDEKNDIVTDESKTFQEMDGFGFALTGGSAILFNSMDSLSRKLILDELFGRGDNSIKVSYLRLSIGASDLSDRVFSYDDLPDGETDPDLEKFSLEPDKKDLIPVLKEIIRINPGITILASPWSPPPWMKTNGSSRGGSLKPEFHDVYARYFVKYIEEMRHEGIHIDAVTIQNEPLHPANNPSMYMLPEEQAGFIKNYLGPEFARAGLSTKIIIYDHNPNRVDYPIAVLNDTAARKYIDGTAFHMYEGSVEAISEVKRAHPDKNLYFTEQWTGARGNFSGDFKWHIKTLIIGAVRNWCKNVIEWNLASDPNQEPHTPGGCTECLGALTINGDSITRNPSYYIIAHASKFVEPGSVRIASNIPERLPNVAFRTPGGKLILIVLNDSDTIRKVRINREDRLVETSLKPGAVATFSW